MLKFHVSRPLQVFLFVFLCDLFVLTVYAWLVSAGSWTNWPTLTTYYDQLATSFAHGQLSLEAKPDSALLALSNPYDPSERHLLTYPKDFSLYKGRYYLYFGPVPAMLLTIFKLVGFGNIGDQDLVFAFIAGIFILQSFIIIKLWRRFFPEISPWIIPPIILISGFIYPFDYILTSPIIYNAAIAGGQFFFLAGFFSAWTALDRSSISRSKLALAGILWIGAIGSRITLVLSVGFVTLMLAFWIFRIYRQDGSVSRFISSIAALGVPLVVGSAILAWYNWARFGSIFETGFSYQLAGSDLQKYSHVLFSPVYVFQNLYNYLLIPPKVKSTFPFLIVVFGKLKPIIPFLPLPKVYFATQNIGLLYSAPFTLFAIIPIISLFSNSKPATTNSMNKDHLVLFKWLIASLAGSYLLEFIFVLIFFWAANRYLVDFLPALVLLSIIGFWQGFRYFSSRPASRVLYLIFGISLIAVSILVSILLAFALSPSYFNNYNPQLWRILTHFFPQ